MPRRHRISALACLTVVIAAGAGACSSSARREAGPAPSVEAPVIAAAPSVHPEAVREVIDAVDGAIGTAWASAGITVAPDADDATFARRATLDLVGRLPEATELEAFLVDPAPDKRDRLLQALTADPAWAEYWTEELDDLWMFDRRDPRVDRTAFRRWLHAQLTARVGYDELVRRVLTASGVSSEGGGPVQVDWSLDEPPTDGVNGAVNYVMQGFLSPQDLAGQSSRVFLGVQIQCAECHDHPNGRWTQADFRRFTSAFMQVDGRPVERGMRGVRAFELEDVATPTRATRRRMRRTGYGEDPPTALDGTDLSGDAPRLALARWMTSPANPYFARAIVNRLWARFLGRGFVEPVDDLGAKDADVVLEPVLDRLARDFVEHGHDLRRLMQVMLSTRAYQRAAVGAAPPTRWEHFALRPMSDTQLLRALVDATGIEPLLEEVAGDRLPRIQQNLRRAFRFTFDVDESGDEDGFSGTVPQALMLENGPLVTAGSSALEGSTLGLALAAEDGRTLDRLYLATLSRYPDDAERAAVDQRLAEAPARSDGRLPRGGGPVARVIRQKRIRSDRPEVAVYEDVMWALLNSSEFFFIH
ncbi:MAG: DUF1549 domain-containing protein [Polyangiaceae bacterium]